MRHIDYYENIHIASKDMLRAAESNDWEALFDAEQRCARNIDMVRALSPVALSFDEQMRKRAIILAVLEDDANIRKLTQPWLDELQGLLQGSGLRRQAESAYLNVARQR
jgi:flagellar protein FliT